MSDKKIEDLWSHVHWLTILASHGSYTGAARRLNVSKAAMSHHISELERAAGVPLVRRTTRSVQLTEAGRQLVDATEGAFRQIERGFAGVHDLVTTPRGLLRVTAPVALARQQLMPELPRFFADYPEVRLELDMSDRIASLAQEGFDLAVRHCSTVPDTHVAWRICTTRPVLAASRAYLRRRGVPRSPEDLASHACLHYPRPQETLVWHLESARHRSRESKVSIPVKGPFAANNSEALRDAAVGGLGIALLPDFSAKLALASGKLVQVLPEWKPVGAFGDHIYALRPYSPQVPRAVAAFVTFLRTTYAGGFGVS